MLIETISSIVDYGNAILITPKDDIIAKYNWLKSSDRDSKMGALSSANKRALILSPGTYTLSSKWELDTPFVDITSLTPDDPSATIVYGNLATAIVEQTGIYIGLSGFTIQNANKIGFDVNAANTGTCETVFWVATYYYVNATGIGIGVEKYDYVYLTGGGVSAGWYTIYAVNSDNQLVVQGCGEGTGVSYTVVSENNSYRFMKFIAPGTGAVSSPVRLAQHCTGLWEFCEGYNYSWVCAENKELRATMRFCKAGFRSFGGDASGAKITGTLFRCIGTTDCFGGCDNEGCDVSGTLIECEAGDDSYAMGKEFSGIAKRCIGGADCFGGYSGTGSSYGTFSGYAEDCIAQGGHNFGMGHASCTLSGTLIRCRNGTMAEYQAGTSNAEVTNFSGICKDCHPWKPTACTSNTTVYPFDNGHTYTNEGASGLITWSLPAAKKGMKYTFCRIDFAAGEDVRVDPNGTEHIYQLDGTDCGAGKYYGSDPNVDAYAEITLECRIDGEWRVVNEMGTWVAET